MVFALVVVMINGNIELQASLSVSVLFLSYILQQRWSPYVTLAALSSQFGLTRHNLDERLKALSLATKWLNSGQLGAADLTGQSSVSGVTPTPSCTQAHLIVSLPQTYRLSICALCSRFHAHLFRSHTRVGR